MSKVRVHELAKELGVTSKEVLAKLQDLGEFVKSASSTVEAPVARRLREAMPPAPEGAAAPKKKAPAKKKAAAKKAPAKKRATTKKAPATGASTATTAAPAATPAAPPSASSTPTASSD